MVRKAIAGMLLLAIVAWAEMTLAPMLAMYGRHLHVQSAFPANGISQNGPHHHAAPQQATKHPCCPPVRKIEAEDALELVAENSGRQDSHRCCFRQGPQSVPAPASDARQFGPQLFSTISPHVSVTAGGSHPIDIGMQAASPPYPRTFGMTLRV